MLLSSESFLELISIPDFPAEIVSVKKNRLGEIKSAEYNFFVNVDLTNAVSRDAKNLVVEVWKKEPQNVSSITTKFSSTKSWAAITKNLEGEVRATLSQDKNENIVLTKKVDLSAYISNDLANALKKENLSTANLTRVQQNSVAAQGISYTSINPFSQNLLTSYKPQTPGVSKVSQSTSTLTALGQQTSFSLQDAQPAKVAQEQFSKTLLTVKQDPATLTAKGYTGYSKPNVSPAVLANVSDAIFTPPSFFPKTTIVKATPKAKLISFSLEINLKDLEAGASFYLNLELEDSFGVKVAEAGTNILHSKLLNSFITPNFAPQINAEYLKPGVVSVSVSLKNAGLNKQLASRVKVFRRLAPALEGGTGSGTKWKEIFDEETLKHDDFRFKDNILASKPIMYRAVVYGSNFKPSETFSSTVVLPLKNFNNKQSGSLTAIPTLGIEGSNSFVVVKVSDVPSDVIAVTVKRFNMTTNSEAERKASRGSGFEYIGQTPRQKHVKFRGQSSDFNAEFTDLTAKPGNNYKYVPVGYTKTGKEIVGSSGIIELPKNAQVPKLKLNVSSPVLVENQKGLTISMNLRGKITSFGFSEVKRSLESGDQKDLFSNDLLKDRDKFESLIGFLVERTNSRTGEVESFGVYSSGVFTDDPETRKIKGIKDLEGGTQYSYNVIGLLNSAEVLFPELKRSEVDPRKLTQFTRKISKFQNPLAIDSATLKSTQRQLNTTFPSRLEAPDPIITGRTNIQITKEFRVPTIRAGEKNIRIEKYRGFNRIVWRYEDVENVDHFKIYILASGGKILLDSIHCDISTAEFYYRHFDKDYNVDFKYMVQPINLAFEELEPIYSSPVKQFDFFKDSKLENFRKITRL